MMKKLFICLVLFVSLVLPGSSWAAFANLVSFGDSLSDNGISRYPVDDLEGFGRSSNGNVWVEYLAMNLGVSHDGRAYGGARTGIGEYDLVWQIDRYRPEAGQDISNTLFTVWAGGNDLRGISGPGDALNVIQSAIHNIGDAVFALYAKGARNILIPNLPDLGKTPEVNGDPVVAGAATFASEQFNLGLGQMLESFGGLQGLTIFEMDVFKYMNDAIIAGDSFKNTTDPWKGSGGRPSDYLFYDDIHPTTDGHWMLAEYAASVLPTPLPGAVWLFGSGMIGLAGVRRRCRR